MTNTECSEEMGSLVKMPCYSKNRSWRRRKTSMQCSGETKVRGGQGVELEKSGMKKKRTNCIPQAAEHVL